MATHPDDPNINDAQAKPPAGEDVLATGPSADDAPGKEKSKSHVTAELLTPSPTARADDDVLFGAEEVSDGVAIEPAAGPAEAQPQKEKSKSHVTAELLTPPPAPRSDHVLFGADEAAGVDAKPAPDANADVNADADDDSAVNLGELPPRSTSASGIDAVAEALESGVNLEDKVLLSPTSADDLAEPSTVKETNKAAAPSDTRAKTSTAPLPARGSSWIGWLAGTSLGILLGAGGMVAGWSYIAPAPMAKTTSSIVQPPPQVPALSPVLKAYPALAAGNYDQVVDDLKDETDPAAVAVRGEAKWLRYTKTMLDANKPIQESDVEVQDALKDLGKDSTRADEVVRFLRESRARAQLVQVRQSVDQLTQAVAKAEADRKQAAALMREIGEALAGANVVAGADQVSADSVRKLIQAIGDNQAALAGVNKILQNANIKDSGATGVAELLAAKKTADGKLTEVDKALAEAKVKDPGAKGVQELVVARAQAQQDRDELNGAIKSAYDEMVKANVVQPGKDPRKALAEGAKAARERGESPLTQPLMYLGSTLASMVQGVGQLVARGVDTTAMATDLALWQGRARFVQTPAQKLDLYAALLQDRSLANAKQLEAIRGEVNWVLTRDAKVTPTDRAKALYVSGLALRNSGKFDAARKALAGAVQHEGARNAAWQNQAQAALTELSDPRAYYLPQIARLQAEGDINGALAEIDRALNAMPGDGTLLAHRGLVRLESLRGKGKLSSEVQQQIRADAQAAVNSPSGGADGAYVLGLLEEELGRYAEAETHFRAAIKTHQGDQDAAVRYRAALVRVLLHHRPAADRPAPPADDR
jgi:tetratricopeptide (TPR) repeat protein